MANPILIDPIGRMIRQNGALSGLIATGSGKVEDGFGNGDCLLIDFSRLLFAVSDGSERRPEASRILLSNLADAFPGPRLSADTEAIKTAVGKIYKEQKYTHKCTFACAALFRKKKGLSAFVSSGGDSSVVVADSSDGSIVLKTASDMNFAGRSNKAPDVSVFELKDPVHRIILATDGFFEALNKIRKPEPGRLPEWLFKEPVCGTAGRFMRKFREKGLHDYDDIGVIIINPFALCRDEAVIIAGGTSPAKELLFSSHSASGRANRLGKKRWLENAGLFDLAGITIKDMEK
jgi:hypothetical protein